MFISLATLHNFRRFKVRINNVAADGTYNKKGDRDRDEEIFLR